MKVRVKELRKEEGKKRASRRGIEMNNSANVLTEKETKLCTCK